MSSRRSLVLHLDCVPAPTEFQGDSKFTVVQIPSDENRDLAILDVLGQEWDFVTVFGKDGDACATNFVDHTTKLLRERKMQFQIAYTIR